VRICLVCIRRDSVKLGDIETRVSHEAVPSKHDAQLLQHLTADLKQDSRSARRASVQRRVPSHLCASFRILAIDRSAAARARAQATRVTLKDDS
jgi:hypothetical protein